MPMLMKKQDKRLFYKYGTSLSYDEMFDRQGGVRTPYHMLHQKFLKMGTDEIKKRNARMHSEMMKQGITFTLYSSNAEEASLERTIPFDMIPRILSAEFIFMFHVLQKNPLAAPSPNPTLHPDKYKPLNKLIDPAHKQEINVKRNKGLQL